MSRKVAPLSKEGIVAARDALRVRLPHFAGCPDYLAESADVVVTAYLRATSAEAQGDLWGRPR